MESQSSTIDRSTFALDCERWSTFLEALDAPTRPLPRLKGLLEEPGYFDPPAASDKHAAQLPEST